METCTVQARYLCDATKGGLCLLASERLNQKSPLFGQGNIAAQLEHAFPFSRYLSAIQSSKSKDQTSVWARIPQGEVPPPGSSWGGHTVNSSASRVPRGWDRGVGVKDPCLRHILCQDSQSHDYPSLNLEPQWPPRCFFSFLNVCPLAPILFPSPLSLLSSPSFLPLF